MSSFQLPEWNENEADEIASNGSWNPDDILSFSNGGRDSRTYIESRSFGDGMNTIHRQRQSDLYAGTQQSRFRGHRSRETPTAAVNSTREAENWYEDSDSSSRYGQLPTSDYQFSNAQRSQYRSSHDTSRLSASDTPRRSIQQGQVFEASEDRIPRNTRQQYSDPSVLHRTGVHNNIDYSRDILPSKPENKENFAQREFLLQESEIITTLTDCFRSLEEYANKEGEFDPKTVSKILTQRRGVFINGIEGIRKVMDHANIAAAMTSASEYPKEAIIFDANIFDLVSSIKSLMKVLGDLHDSNRKTYLSQMKKLKDTSNVAIRTTIQNLKAESTIEMGKLKEDCNSKWESHLSKSEETIHRLTLELDEARNQLHAYRSLCDKSEASKSVAVESALHEAKMEFEKERNRLETVFKEENKRIKEDSKNKLFAIVEQHKMQLDASKKHEEEIRELMGHDKKKLEAEIQKLREQVVQALGQVSHEKDRCAAKIQNERAASDRALQDIQTETLKTQSQLQAQLAKQLQEAQNEYQKRYKEQQDSFQREKDSLVVSHALEIEKQMERCKSEIKRAQGAVDVKVRNEVVKAKHTYEQEINKLLRENERLQKIVARYGGGQLSSRPSPSHVEDHGFDRASTGNVFAGIFAPGSMQNVSSLQREQPEQTALGNSLRRSFEEEPTPSMHTPQPMDTKLNWGELNRSLAMQESQLGQSHASSYSPSRSRNANGMSKYHSPHATKIINTIVREDPPSTFAIDEVLAAADELHQENASGLSEIGGPVKGGLRVSDAAEKVENYLGKLQEYLEGVDIY